MLARRDQVEVVVILVVVHRTSRPTRRARHAVANQKERLKYAGATGARAHTKCGIRDVSADVTPLPHTRVFSRTHRASERPCAEREYLRNPSSSKIWRLRGCATSSYCYRCCYPYQQPPSPSRRHTPCSFVRHHRRAPPPLLISSRGAARHSCDALPPTPPHPQHRASPCENLVRS